MISVNVSFIGNDVKSLTVSGHANYDKYGKDIVCAGVSAVVTGGINALENQVENIEIINKENMLGVKVINSNEYIQIVLNTILIQLETIENSYKKYIKITK
jgi:uncharacterized protein YsxB (DUF464 family)